MVLLEVNVCGLIQMMWMTYIQMPNINDTV